MEKLSFENANFDMGRFGMFKENFVVILKAIFRKQESFGYVVLKKTFEVVWKSGLSETRIVLIRSDMEFLKKSLWATSKAIFRKESDLVQT